MKPTYLLLALALASAGHAADKPLTAADFATKKGMLDENACRLYIIHRQKTGADRLLKPGSMTIDQAKLNEHSQDYYNQILLWNTPEQPNKPPFTVAHVEAALNANKPPDRERPAWQKIPGVTEKYSPKLENKDSSWNIGPLAIRRDLDEVKKDSKDLKDVKGAKFAFADNHQSGENGAWNSQGVIYWPFAADVPFRNSGSVYFSGGFATEWIMAEREAPKTKVTDPGDAEELTASVPLTFYISPPARKEAYFEPNIATPVDPDAGPSSAYWVFQGKPYMNTDFSFDHEIYGATASLRYVGAVFGSELYLGKYQNFSDAGSGWLVDSNLRYQLTLTPTLDYSYVNQGGTHTTRKPGDDWLRLGAKAGFDLAFGPPDTPFTLGTSYQFFDTVDGKGGYSYLWKSNATWWMTPELGLSLEHAIGNTPVADKEIDQTTFGLEFRY